MSWLSPGTSLFVRLIYFIYLFNRFHHDYNAKKDEGKKYIWTRHKKRGTKVRDTQQSEAPNWVCPYGKYINTNYVNIKHYIIINYKNPLVKMIRMNPSRSR